MLKNFVAAYADFIRLVQALIAVAVVFGALDITAEQIAALVLALETAFQYASRLAFQKDLDDLNGAVVRKEDLAALDANTIRRVP